MESVLLFVVGIVVALIGLAVSIALHEVGHLLPAKLFNVRVPQYMIGFGPTLWSKRFGETEYGIKAVPLGGYISMIGMFPPKHRGEAPREGGTGYVNSIMDQAGVGGSNYVTTMIEDARSASVEGVGSHEEHRTFYNLPVWKRLVIMAGGPAMNIVLALITFLIVCTGIGMYQPTTTVEEVYRCVVPASEQAQTDTETCTTPSPAFEGGLQPGDVVVAIDGTPVDDWDTVSGTIAKSAGIPLTLTVDRGGSQTDLVITPQVNTVYQTDEFSGQILEDAAGAPLTEEVGFVGFSVGMAREHMPVGYAFEFTGYNIERVVGIVLSLPERVVEMWQAGFGGAERDPNGPMSVVGVGRITGEITAQTSIPVVDRVSAVLMTIGSLNVALGIMNLIPLPPLDGGHILAALVDGLRRAWAKVRGKAEPAHFDTAKLIPVTMTVSVLLMAMTALFVYVDIVNPVKLFE